LLPLLRIAKRFLRVTNVARAAGIDETSFANATVPSPIGARGQTGAKERSSAYSSALIDREAIPTGTAAIAALIAAGKIGTDSWIFTNIGHIRTAGFLFVYGDSASKLVDDAGGTLLGNSPVLHVRTHQLRRSADHFAMILVGPSTIHRSLRFQLDRSALWCSYIAWRLSQDNTWYCDNQHHSNHYAEGYPSQITSNHLTLLFS